MSLLDIFRKPHPHRSPQWPAFRERWLLAHPTCAACGGTDGLEAHHKKPVHLYPALELVITNLITLCEKRRCHLVVGHAYNWKRENTNVEQVAALLLAAVKAAVNKV